MSMRSASCPCCGSSEILRHIRSGGVYWFCMSCRQEIPLLQTNPAPILQLVKQS